MSSTADVLVGPPAVVGRVHPSVLSRSFLGIDPLVFSETQHDVRGPCVVVLDRVGLVKKKNCPKMGENGLKTV